MKALSNSKLRLLAASVAAVGATVALPKFGQAQTVTYILSINDDGHGDDVLDHYALYAAESGTDTYGFDGIGINIGGVTTSDFLEDDLPEGVYNPGNTDTQKNATLEVGFIFGYGPYLPIGGAQDTPDLAFNLQANKPPGVALVYGIGQVSGSLDATAVALGGPGATLKSLSGTSTDSFGQTVGQFSGAVLVADGTFAPGETPAFIPNNNSALLFIENGQANFNDLGDDTESIQEGGITFVTLGQAALSSLNLFTPSATASNGGTNNAAAFGSVAASGVVVIPHTAAANSFVPVTAAVNNNKGYFDYSGFSQGDTVYVALSFTSNGSDPIYGGSLIDLINYINANDNGAGFIASDYGSAPAAVQNALGAGVYDVLLTSTAGATDPFFNYDFSQFVDAGLPMGSLDVAGIGVIGTGAVPEPAALGLLAMGGMALIRRRRC